LQADADAEEGLVSGDVVVDGGQVASVGKGFEAVAEMTDAGEDYFLGPETLVASLSQNEEKSSAGWDEELQRKCEPGQGQHRPRHVCWKPQSSPESLRAWEHDMNIGHLSGSLGKQKAHS
jgi:hypothetical protein